VWRIRDVYPGSRIRLFSIPDPNCLHPGSRILIKELKYFNPKKTKKWFPSSKKYDPDCSSRIPDPDADFLPSRIPDPGVKKAPNPGSRIRIRNTREEGQCHWPSCHPTAAVPYQLQVPQLCMRHESCGGDSAKSPAAIH
jgi:hypothetical protein